jgi:tetratricopeptide (TPR) repeat protein
MHESNKKNKTRTRTPFILLISAGVLFVSVTVVAHFTPIKTTVAHYVWGHYHADKVALMFDGADADLLFTIGNYYFGEGSYDAKKAERYFQGALKLDPSLEGPHYQLARVYFVQSEFIDALREINEEIELHPNFGRSHYVRGLIYGYTGRLSDAESEFRAFLAWKPNSWAGNNDLAWVYFQDGKYTQARDTARAGLKIEPNNPWLLNSLGVALLNTNDKKGAKESFTKALAALSSMTEQEWGAAYPGNDPNIYDDGFSKMKISIQENLNLL